MIKIQNTLLDWILGFIIFFTVSEPWLLRSANSLGSYETAFLIKAVVLIVAIAAYKCFKIKIKNERVSQVIYHVLVTLGLYCLLWLTLFAVALVIHFISGAVPEKSSAELAHAVGWTVGSFILLSMLAIRFKKSWLIGIAAILPCLGAAIWALIKLQM